MDWIEKLIGLSPDGGDGTTEAAILFLSVIAVGAIMALRLPTVRRILGETFRAWRIR